MRKLAFRPPLVALRNSIMLRKSVMCVGRVDSFYNLVLASPRGLCFVRGYPGSGNLIKRVGGGVRDFFQSAPPRGFNME